MRYQKIRLRPPKGNPLGFQVSKRLMTLLVEMTAGAGGHIEASRDMYRCIWVARGNELKDIPPLRQQFAVNGVHFTVWWCDHESMKYLAPVDPEKVHLDRTDPPERSAREMKEMEAIAQRMISDGEAVIKGPRRLFHGHGQGA